MNLAPGTRSGIVPDECLQVFIAAVTELAEPLRAALEQWDQAESDKASRQILKQVHRAFVHALRELPPNEYLFFDIPQLHPSHQSNGHASGDGRLVPAVSQVAEGEDEVVADQPVLFPAEPGPLASVHIRPHTARRVINDECGLSATAKDAQGMAIPDGVELREGTGRLLQVDGPRCRVTSQQAGVLIVQVTVAQNDIQVITECTVKFLENLSEDDRDSSKGLPSYRLEAERGQASPVHRQAVRQRSRADQLRPRVVGQSAGATD